MTIPTWGLGLCEPKKKRKPATPESLVLKEVIRYLGLCRLGKVTRNNVGMVWTGPKRGEGRPVKFGTPGQADVTVELTDSPLCIHVECKAGKGKPSPIQIQWLDTQRKRGHICLVAWGALDVYTALVGQFPDIPVPGGRRKKVVNG